MNDKKQTVADQLRECLSSHGDYCLECMCEVRYEGFPDKIDAALAEKDAVIEVLRTEAEARVKRISEEVLPPAHTARAMYLKWHIPSPDIVDELNKAINAAEDLS